MRRYVGVGLAGLTLLVLAASMLRNWPWCC
jgi:hypothetical protein